MLGVGGYHPGDNGRHDHRHGAGRFGDQRPGAPEQCGKQPHKHGAVEPRLGPGAGDRPKGKGHG